MVASGDINKASNLSVPSDGNAGFSLYQKFKNTKNLLASVETEGQYSTRMNAENDVSILSSGTRPLVTNLHFGAIQSQGYEPIGMINIETKDGGKFGRASSSLARNKQDRNPKIINLNQEIEIPKIMNKKKNKNDFYRFLLMQSMVGFGK